MRLPSFQPQPVFALEDTGLPRGLVFDLLLKRAFLEGTTTLHRLSMETKLEFGVVQGVYQEMQREQLSETKGVRGMDYAITLTSKGRHLAEEIFRKNQYCGAAPVPLASYCQAVREQVFR